MIVPPDRLMPLAESVAKSIKNATPFSVSEFVNHDALPTRLRTPEAFFDAVRVKVGSTEGTPRYRRFPDHDILMPPVDWLGQPVWNACYCHELLHFSEVAFAWDEPPWKGELRAEIGESLLCALLGIPPCADRTNFNKWIGTWQAQLLDDPLLAHIVTRAAVDGVEHLIKRASYVRTEEDRRIEAGLMALFEKAKQMAG